MTSWRRVVDALQQVAGTSRRRTVVVYTRDGCGLCRRAEEVVAQEAAGHEVVLVDVDGDDELQRRYNVRVPVVTVDDVVVAEGLVDAATVRRALRRGTDGGRSSVP